MTFSFSRWLSFTSSPCVHLYACLFFFPRHPAQCYELVFCCFTFLFGAIIRHHLKRVAFHLHQVRVFAIFCTAELKASKIAQLWVTAQWQRCVIVMHLMRPGHPEAVVISRIWYDMIWYETCFNRKCSKKQPWANLWMVLTALPGRGGHNRSLYTCHKCPCWLNFPAERWWICLVLFRAPVFFGIEHTFYRGVVRNGRVGCIRCVTHHKEASLAAHICRSTCRTDWSYQTQMPPWILSTHISRI